ncbi:MAG TPA: hypothetical protein VHZ95_10810 [Polyangiales bacterium]|nr:hypothetical protein [Polyangiales bacterium]
MYGAIGRRAEIVVTDDGRTMSLVATVDNGEEAGSAWAYRRALHVELSLEAPASCTIDGLARRVGVHAHEGWDLESGDPRDGGPFKDAYWWLSDQLWDANLTGCTRSRSALAAHTSGETCHAKLDEIFQQAARRAIEICDADARAVALRYPRDARFFVYAALIDDPTGRVRQMIDVCPNLLTLAAACDRNARDIIEGVRVGRKLGELLARAVQWAARRCMTSAATAFVRRLPLLALEELLDLLHAPGIDINDLPIEAEATKRWVNIMAAWARAARDVADREVAEKLGGFYSKHGLVARSLGFEVDAFGAIGDWLHHTGAPVPTRRSSPHQVIRAVELWHETLYRDVEYAPETPLAKAPVPDRSVAGIDATPLDTVGSLVAEGQAMRHCVAMSACHAVVGTQFIYSARIDDARVTIAVSGSPGNWRLVEAAGFANRQLEVHEQIAIERWLAALPKRIEPRVASPTTAHDEAACSANAIER